MNWVARWVALASQALRRDRERWLLAGAAAALAIACLDLSVPAERSLFEHVVVLDITQSMNVQDQMLAGQPVSRLTLAKQALRRALRELPCGSKVGWAVFTEYRSFLLMAPVEVCANLGELQSTLGRIDGRMAWSGNSEVAKGLHSGIAVVKQLPGKPSLVFVTDGQEAPPIDPRHRPAFDDKPGDVAGLLVGVGGLLPVPIPKSDPLGRPLGFWRADEVMQTDPRSQGRGASVGGERMAEDAAASAPPMPGATPGSEHLSSLREGYLRLLAGELGLGYHQLQPGADGDASAGLVGAMTTSSLARPVPARIDLRPLFAGLALLLLLARHAGWLRRRLRSARSQT